MSTLLTKNNRSSREKGENQRYLSKLMNRNRQFT